MKKLIIKYLYDLVNYLDGRGLVISDDDLLKKTLKEDFGNFNRLKKIVKGK